eukprot:2794953-Prymnesium_polylepis.2
MSRRGNVLRVTSFLPHLMRCMNGSIGVESAASRISSISALLIRISSPQPPLSTRSPPPSPCSQ